MPKSVAPSFRIALTTVLVGLAWNAGAVGLGEVRGSPYLGEPLSVDIELVLADGESADISCFRLVAPKGDGEIPRVRDARLQLKKGSRSVLEVRADQVVRDPLLQFGMMVGCGRDVQRDYVLFASPRPVLPRANSGAVPSPASTPVAESVLPVGPVVVPRSPRIDSASAGFPQAKPRPRYRPEAQEGNQRLPAEMLTPLPASSRRDVGRVYLVGSLASGAELSLQLAPELRSWRGEEGGALVAQRDILRLEYRMLMALNDQAISQLAAAEKLRNMEATLGELQQRAGEFSQRMESQSQPAPAIAPTTAEVIPPSAKPAQEARIIVPEDELVSDEMLIGLAGGGFFGVLGWFGWRHYQRRRQAAVVAPTAELDDFLVEPVAAGGHDQAPEVDFPLVLPDSDGHATPLDVDLGGDLTSPVMGRSAISSSPAPAFADIPELDVPSPVRPEVEEARLDEQFEANPVMELADIMLSFGRVKGAAQALQEFVDHNPQEALQPWIRLIEVYRLAGMREEFERVAGNLNRHFNVEVLAWEAGEAGGSSAHVGDSSHDIDFVLDGMAPPPTVQSRPQSLEQFSHISRRLTQLWSGPESDCKSYIEDLLRDNRGGERGGFPISVVEELLFLIELIDTKVRLAKQN